ncbi:hypothetical protein VTK73DRAFT_6060 [Phialemonium thermophilum]|uniref:Tyrosine specific protein phosphatases domain-containing protein n=1 Tax=Phialemonium thermophilum TaxID=223376 RepID=A0ABR3XW62_9PEZI
MPSSLRSPCQDGFDAVLNFRDVGQTVNQYLQRKLVREGLLYRSGRLDDASCRDRHRLKEEFRIRTILDLRTKTELLNAAKKHQEKAARNSELGHIKSHDAAAEPLQIPGLRYREVKLTGRRFEMHLVRQLCWWSLFKFFFLFLAGYRMKAIAILGREVMQPRGLVSLGLDTLDQSQPEILEALESFLEPSALPVLVHCTQGKDRTGIIIILVLLILGIPTEAINFDYRLSDEALLPERESRLAEIREIGLTDEFGDTVKDMVPRVVAHLQDKYGGPHGYLDVVGFDGPKRDQLKELLIQ